MASPTPSPAGAPSIAVLPFENGSGDPEQAYFSDGIAEDLLNELSKIGGLTVIARDSTFALRDRDNAHEVAQVLGVRYVLRGRAGKNGSRVRIEAALLDASLPPPSSASPIWADQFDHELPDLFTVLHKVLENVVSAIEPAMRTDKYFQLKRRAPVRPQAWDYVMRAIARIWQRNEVENIQGQALLEQAIRVDPNYAHAHSVLAFSRVFSVHSGWSEAATVLPKAMEAAQTALKLNADDAFAHAAMAYGYMIAHRNDKSLESARKALQLNPNFALGYYILSLALSSDGKGAEAIAAAERAIRISPLDPFKGFFSAAAGFANFAAGRYADAADWARRANEESPDSVVAHRLLAASAAQAGLLDEARAAVADLKRLHPGITLALVDANAPLASPELRARYLEGLRKAGLQ